MHDDLELRTATAGRLSSELAIDDGALSGSTDDGSITHIGWDGIADSKTRSGSSRPYGVLAGPFRDGQMDQRYQCCQTHLECLHVS